MKKILMLSLLLLIAGVGDVAARPKAKWERRIERSKEQDKWEMDRIWRRRSSYFNLAYVSQNTTTNIDANHTRDDLIGNSHSGTNGTAHACVDIGHNADLAIRKGRLITDRLYLSGSCFFQFAGIAKRNIICANDFYHRRHSFQI